MSICHHSSPSFWYSPSILIFVLISAALALHPEMPQTNLLHFPYLSTPYYSRIPFSSHSPLSLYHSSFTVTNSFCHSSPPSHMSWFPAPFLECHQCNTRMSQYCLCSLATLLLTLSPLGSSLLIQSPSPDLFNSPPTAEMAMSSILNTDDIKKALDAFAGEYQHSRDRKKLVPKKAGARTFGFFFPYVVLYRLHSTYKK